MGRAEAVRIAPRGTVKAHDFVEKKAAFRRYCNDQAPRTPLDTMHNYHMDIPNELLEDIDKISGFAQRVYP